MELDAKQGGCGKMWGFFWAKVGLDLSMHWNVARGGSLIKVQKLNFLVGWKVGFIVGVVLAKGG